MKHLGYPGLYGEVVTLDIYRLKTVNFPVNLFFDIGANFGFATRFARRIYKDALIVALEPDPDNIAIFKEYTPEEDAILIEAALGKGPFFFNPEAINGAHKTYLDEGGLCYPKGYFAGQERYKPTEVPGIMLSELVDKYWRSDWLSVMKLDCEGGENTIWDHEPSMEALRKMDFIALEHHAFAATHKQVVELKELRQKALDTLLDTHDCEQDHIYFWARRKGL